MIEALLYEKLDNKTVHCYLCGHECKIPDQGFGFCGVRQNKGGILYTHSYGRLVAANVDPVEKKPLYHFLPGTSSFSIATLGCNFRCGFCQNWQISQADCKDQQAPGRDFASRQIVEAALSAGCASISYTYTEPTIFFEYALETAKLAKEKGLYNIFVTNGYMTSECLQMVRPYLDAANVDLKFFSETSYKKICAARLAPVLDSIKLMHKLGIWVEVTTLIIPGENDSDKELSSIAGFIAEVDKNIPWHISRFNPDYKFNTYVSTPEETLDKAARIGAKTGLNYVYIGNVPGQGEDTYCHKCKKLLVKRVGFSVKTDEVVSGKCTFCGTAIPGFFK